MEQSASDTTDERSSSMPCSTCSLASSHASQYPRRSRYQNVSTLTRAHQENAAWPGLKVRWDRFSAEVKDKKSPLILPGRASPAIPDREETPPVRNITSCDRDGGSKKQVVGSQLPFW